MFSGDVLGFQRWVWVVLGVFCFDFYWSVVYFDV